MEDIHLSGRVFLRRHREDYSHKLQICRVNKIPNLVKKSDLPFKTGSNLELPEHE